jgi:hypothetical protein|tara:strand:- start:1174 stop:1362 length:189 start_codon:yes stop_codon:yes gene_type:complete
MSATVRKTQNVTERMAAVWVASLIREVTGIEMGPYTYEFITMASLILLGPVLPDLASIMNKK